MQFKGISLILMTFGILLLSVSSQAEPLTVRISRADCSRLIQHRPGDDVAYQPGVDVHGRAVAPANMDGDIQLELPQSYRVRIEVDTFDRFGLPDNPSKYDADIEVGEVLVELDGRAYFNGQPLQDDEAFELSRLCQQQLSSRP